MRVSSSSIVIALTVTVSAGAAEIDTLPRYVPDVLGQFQALSLRPDGLAFAIGDSPDPEQCKHYQGMARVNGPDGTPYLFITRSGVEPDGAASAFCSDSDDPGNLLIVRMGSRDRNGERLRSNRFARNWSLVNPLPPNINPLFWPTPPDVRDRVVRTITFDGNFDQGQRWPRPCWSRSTKARASR